MAEEDGLQTELLRQGEREEGARNGDDLYRLRASLSHITDRWRSKAQAKQAWWQHDHAAAEDDRRAPWRKKLGEALESTAAHITIVVLLLIDLLATAVDILKTVHNKSHDLGHCITLVQSCECTESFEISRSWTFLYWISISILCFLVLNVLGLVVALGFTFFKHAGYVLDLVVVVTALCLELFLDSDTAGLLVILNLWRIIRVAHGIFEVTDEAWEKDIHKLEAQVQGVEAAHKRDLELLRFKDERIAELERQLMESGRNQSFSFQ